MLELYNLENFKYFDLRWQRGSVVMEMMVFDFGEKRKHHNTTLTWHGMAPTIDNDTTSNLQGIIPTPPHTDNEGLR
jgi:hypothetical protein